MIITISNPKGNRIAPKGKADTTFKKLLEKMVKQRQKQELTKIFGEKKKASGKKTLSKKRPRLAGYFSSARPLSRTYKGKEYKATLLKSGKIKYKNKSYDSPTGAAKIVVDRGSVNGWSFWYVNDDDGNWIKLSRL